jgi:diguanylate cyclase (GGDEF)-like protein
MSGGTAEVDGSVMAAEQLSAELVAIEDRFVWDVKLTLEIAEGLEAAAARLGSVELVVRARLCQANMWVRRGDAALAARRLWEIDRWATEHDRPLIRARVHVVLAAVHKHLGDLATSLEHAVRGVEYIDDTASVHVRVWHRAKLADALAEVGSMDAARTRYAQAEQLATSQGEHRLHMAVLNNFAYSEFAAGAHARAQQVAVRLQAMAVRYGFTLDPADLDTIGSIQNENGLYADAERTLRTCLALHGEGHHDDADALAEYLLTLCRAQRGQGATDRAQATLEKSRAICEERGLGDVLVRVHQEQAEVYAARGQFAEAFATHKIFFVAYDQLHSSQREAQARTRQAMFETNEAREDAKRFHEQARRDPLTSLRNRRYVDEQLPLLIADPLTPVTIAILDLDHFKRINDELSHEVGDRVLTMVAKLLETELMAAAPAGFAARMGGEEFLLALPGLDLNAAVAMLETVRAAIRSLPWPELTGELPVTVSIGVACSQGLVEPTQQGLLSTADRHLYIAKHHGRDRVVWDADPDETRRRYRDSDRFS